MATLRKTEMPHSMTDLPHPGYLLKTFYLPAYGIAPEDLAAQLDGTLDDLSAVLCGDRPITLDIASHLAAQFSTTVSYWISLQKQWDAAQQAHGLSLPRPLANSPSSEV